MSTIFSIVGRAGVGKTTLITRLVVEIKRRGFSVGVIKHCPRGFEMDKEGKDSWAFTQAGVSGVLLVSPQRIGLIKEKKEEIEISQIANQFFNELDFVLVEGFKNATNVRKIEVLRSSISRELQCLPEELVAVVSDFLLELPIPQFTHEDIGPIVNFMKEGYGKDSRT